MILSNLLLATITTLASAEVIKVPLTERGIDTVSNAKEILEARGIIHDTLHMGPIWYMADVEIGTPPQNVSVIFDTGSPLLWVPGSNSTECESKRGCLSSYDVSKSSSWRYQKEGANWGGNGNWGLDTLSYAGQTLKDFNTWVSKDKMANALGIFGQSPHDNPSSNFVQGLAHAGKISRPIFSVNAERPSVKWGSSANEGIAANVYYGGFDKAKYEGPLTTINCTHKGGYGMPMSGFSVQGETVPNEIDHEIVLDTGGVYLRLTNNTLQFISKKFGGEGKFSKGTWEVGCDSKPEVTYEFGETKIDTDISSFLKKDSDGKCRLDLDPIPDTQVTLLTGPLTISRALVIYDNERSQITIGKAKYTDESDVVEITGDIPGAVPYQPKKKAPATTLAAKATGN